MGTQRFHVVATVDVTVELDDALIASVDDEWREHFYELRTPKDIAEMIAFNLLKERSLQSLDGFANQPADRAKITDEEWSYEIEELRPKKSKTG